MVAVSLCREVLRFTRSNWQDPGSIYHLKFIDFLIIKF